MIKKSFSFWILFFLIYFYCNDLLCKFSKLSKILPWNCYLSYFITLATFLSIFDVPYFNANLQRKNYHYCHTFTFCPWQSNDVAIARVRFHRFTCTWNDNVWVFVVNAHLASSLHLSRYSAIPRRLRELQSGQNEDLIRHEMSCVAGAEAHLLLDVCFHNQRISAPTPF